MRHRVKRLKIKKGHDASKSIIRKLVRNFLKYGKLTTTLKRAKILKANVDRIVPRSKERTEANRNVLLRFFGDPKLVEILFEQVGPAFKRNSGFVRFVRLGQRVGDGAETARVEWVKPIMLGEKKKEKNADKKGSKISKDEKKGEKNKEVKK